MACMEQTEILGIIYRGKSCFYLSKGLKENVTETFESEQTFQFAWDDHISYLGNLLILANVQGHIMTFMDPRHVFGFVYLLIN